MLKSISSGDIFPKIIWEAQSRSKSGQIPGKVRFQGKYREKCVLKANHCKNTEFRVFDAKIGLGVEKGVQIGFWQGFGVRSGLGADFGVQIGFWHGFGVRSGVWAGIWGLGWDLGWDRFWGQIRGLGWEPESGKKGAAN